jgi:hypothetical protein
MTYVDVLLEVIPQRLVQEWTLVSSEFHTRCETTLNHGKETDREYVSI